jgi:hypothetical protein
MLASTWNLKGSFAAQRNNQPIIFDTSAISEDDAPFQRKDCLYPPLDPFYLTTLKEFIELIDGLLVGNPGGSSQMQQLNQLMVRMLILNVDSNF